MRLKCRLKKRQVKSLRQFAEAMKWPNLGETLDQLELRDEESSLNIVSSDAFAFFSGLVVPGVSVSLRDVMTTGAKTQIASITLPYDEHITRPRPR